MYSGLLLQFHIFEDLKKNNKSLLKNIDIKKQGTCPTPNYINSYLIGLN